MVLDIGILKFIDNVFFDRGNKSFRVENEIVLRVECNKLRIYIMNNKLYKCKRRKLQFPLRVLDIMEMI